MQQTARWLQNRDLDDFFLKSLSVRERVCAGHWHLMESLERLTSRRDLTIMGYANYHLFCDWCRDDTYLSRARSVLYAAE